MSQGSGTGGETALFVMCAYGLAPSARARPDRPSSGILSRVFFPNLRTFIATYRDFYANPRSLDYMLERAEELHAEVGFSRLALVVDKAWGEDAEASAQQLFTDGPEVAVEMAHLGRHGSLDRQRLRTCDRVVLFYPDALGLGRHGLETRLLEIGSPQLVEVVNGRRRRFVLDSRIRRALAWRRFLARTRLCELLFAIAVVPVAASLAALDAVRGTARR